jgi:hypothetical protein
MPKQVHIRLDLVVDVPEGADDDLDERAQQAFCEHLGDVGVVNVSQGVTVVEVYDA